MYLVLFIAMTLSGLTIACGVYLLIKKDDSNLKRIRKLVRVSVAAYLIYQQDNQGKCPPLLLSLRRERNIVLAYYIL